MNRCKIDVSVIIPTHNRTGSLRRTLDSLRLQSYPPEKFEVVVVADGCIDDTVEMLRSYEAPFCIDCIEQEGTGAASARNSGAELANGALLIFLDDDVVPSPELIDAHVRKQQQQLNQVTLGPYPPVFEGKQSFVHIQKRLWWTEKFQSMSQSYHRFTYRDMLSGNFSIDATFFRNMKGFDTSIKSCGGEDYEFGVRLLKAGCTFTFTPEAVGYHYEHETTDLDRMLSRMRQEGGAYVQICRRHLELRPTIGLEAVLNFRGSFLSRKFRKWAIEGSSIGDYLSSYFRRKLDLLEGLRLRGLWLRLYWVLCRYSYWCGVGDQLSSIQAITDFLQAGPINPYQGHRKIEIDLANGLPAAMQRLDEERPDSATVYYGAHIVGSIPFHPGAERLRGVHLRPILAVHLAWPLLKAIATENAFNGKIDENGLFQCLLPQDLRGNHAPQSP